jgi:hypothetical protein
MMREESDIVERIMTGLQIVLWLQIADVNIDRNDSLREIVDAE